jgi:hypothetical protein
MNRFSKVAAGAFLVALGLFSVVPAAASDQLDAVTVDGPAFSAPIHFSKYLVSPHTLLVPQHGAITVVAKAHMEGPSGCSYQSYTITVVEQGGASAGGRNYATKGLLQVGTWADLPAGTYHLEFELQNTNPDCNVVGELTAQVSP